MFLFHLYRCMFSNKIIFDRHHHLVNTLGHNWKTILITSEDDLKSENYKVNPNEARYNVFASSIHNFDFYLNSHHFSFTLTNNSVLFCRNGFYFIIVCLLHYDYFKIKIIIHLSISFSLLQLTRKRKLTHLIHNKIIDRNHHNCTNTCIVCN